MELDFFLNVHYFENWCNAKFSCILKEINIHGQRFKWEHLQLLCTLERCACSDSSHPNEHSWAAPARPPEELPHLIGWGLLLSPAAVAVHRLDKAFAHGCNCVCTCLFLAFFSPTPALDPALLLPCLTLGNLALVPDFGSCSDPRLILLATDSCSNH